MELVVWNQSHRKEFTKGFTLIELLIVVAIIAILAAIAIPNFLAAQVRAKVSRVKANMRTATTAIESYYVDNNSYPATFVGGTYTYALPISVTTPIAYLTSVPDDIFDSYNGLGPGFIPIKYRSPGEAQSGDYFAPIPNPSAVISLYMENPSDPGNRNADVFTNQNNTDVRNVRYTVFSLGPGVLLARDAQTNESGFWDENANVTSNIAHFPGPYRMWYDPTNGTVSIGEVVRLSSGPVSP